MKHRQIEAFRYTMITGTTTGAAETMSITQPAVSRLISDLEASLRFQLFTRVKGRLKPTTEALRFYEAVTKFYTGFDHLELVAEQVRKQKPADLKICATPALSTFFFPKAVKRFKASHPGVNFLIEGFSSSEIISRLQTRLTHLAVTLAFPELPGIVQEPLVEAAHVCAMHHTHPLAQKSRITAEDLRGESVLNILPTGLVDWNKVAKALGDAGVDYQNGIGIQNSHTGYSLIAENLAVALIEPFAASTWERNGVITRPFDPAVNFTYVIAYTHDRRHTNEMILFSEILHELCEGFGTSVLSK